MATKTKMAPVAEYWGVAIVELEGEKRAVWNGVEYKTDGKTWLALRAKDGDKLQMLGFPNEYVTRQFIDEVCQGKQPEFDSPSVFLNQQEVLDLCAQCD